MFCFSPTGRLVPLTDRETSGTDASSKSSIGLSPWPTEVEIETNLSESSENRDPVDVTSFNASVGATSIAGMCKFSCVETVQVEVSNGRLPPGYDAEGKTSLTIKLGLRAGTWGWADIQIQSSIMERPDVRARSFKSVSMIDDYLWSAISKETSFSDQLTCLLQGFRKELMKVLRPERPLRRLPKWWFETDTQTGAYPYKQLMMGTFEKMLDKVFAEVERSILAETSSEKCERIVHLMRKCDGFRCKEIARQEHLVTSRYGDLISVEFSW